MVDSAILARKIAAIRDAVERIRAVLPSDRDAFLADRTAREVVVLNLFVAFQEVVDVAAHWISDAGWDVPQGYAQLFQALANRGVVAADTAQYFGKAAGFRNLVAHRYGTLDHGIVYDVAASELHRIDDFCAQLARAATSP